MIKTILASTLSIFTSNFVTAQSNFSGTWTEPDLEIVEGIQYSNAMAKAIKVTQTKDSIKLERTTVGNDGDITVTETFPLNGKKISRVTKSSKRTITTTATWNSDGKTLTIISTYSYTEKPTEIEYKNTEVWSLTDGQLLITKTSDAAVTDDWVIKGSYKRI